MELFIVNTESGTEAVFSTYEKATNYLYELNGFKPGFDLNDKFLLKHERLWGYWDKEKADKEDGVSYHGPRVWIDKETLDEVR